MPLIDWKPEFSVEIPSIDAEHRKLIDYVNELHEAMRAGKSAEILGKVVKGLVDYTKTHFAREEKLMKDHGYGELDRHAGEHAALIKQVGDVVARFEANKTTGLSIEVSTFLRDWLQKHILGTDKRYSAHLKAKGVK